MLKLAIVFGGPSLERGISLNSARSLMDHLPQDRFSIIPLYVDTKKRFFQISSSHLYSNTPSDFDFKIHQIAQQIDPSELVVLLKSVHLAFNVIHGPFGEDGELQAFLQKHQIPFVGPDHKTCRHVFLKHLAHKKLKKLGYPVWPFHVVTPKTKRFPPIRERSIVKPSSGGSSIGVYSVATKEQAEEKAKTLFSLFEDQHVLIEPFCEGKEFTITILESKNKDLIVFDPTEIQTSYENHSIFDYRKKYLPHHETRYHTPPRFDRKITETIKKQAADLFRDLHLRDVVRIDGWVLNDGTILFSDFNIACGLEQNSFLFQQASFHGMSHEEVILTILENACLRYRIPFPSPSSKNVQEKKKVFVLFGGTNAERQVSLMSGTNVWLKLLRSPLYTPIPFLLGKDNQIWELAYHHALHHTVEEIQEKCEREKGLSLEQWLLRAQKEKAFPFLALHGGIGENGALQKMLEEKKLPFNGSSSFASSLCMDKYLTGQIIEQAAHPNITALPKQLITFSPSFQAINIWKKTTEKFRSDRLIIKPKEDGCSAGIVLLESGDDLEKYGRFVLDQVPMLPPFSFARQSLPVEMPSLQTEFFLEPFIETDLLLIQNEHLSVITKTGWIELTVGVLEVNGTVQSFHPSITVVEGSVLSLEEKFQGGTGINITPPPPSILSSDQILKIKKLIEKTAEILHLRNYARIDIFFNRMTDQMIVIEANTLPGLTPSTVLYHQALAENPSLSPRNLLESIIGTAWENHIS